MKGIGISIDHLVRLFLTASPERLGQTDRSHTRSVFFFFVGFSGFRFVGFLVLFGKSEVVAPLEKREKKMMRGEALRGRARP